MRRDRPARSGPRATRSATRSRRGRTTDHVGPKASGGKAGEEIRDTLSSTGVSVNAAKNSLAARGTSAAASATGDRATPAVTDSVADHTRQHGEKKIVPLAKRLSTVEGDDDAVRSTLSDASHIQSEGGTVTESEFYLDSKFDRGTDDDPPPKKPPRKPTKK